MAQGKQIEVNEKVVSPTKQKTKDNIIRVSKYLFDKNGIENTTIMQISTECKITRRTIYDHFPSKIEIIFVILIEYFDELYDIDYSKFYKEQDVNKLKQLLHIIFDKYLENPVIMRFLVNYYQANPKKVEEENQIFENTGSIGKLRNYIDFEKIDVNNTKRLKEKTEVILQYILGIGMRYSLRSDAFLGITRNISREELHDSLDVLLHILD